jgi:transcriptional regulator with XRE-family HTH domain
MLRLRFWRLSRGLSQSEAARQLGMSHLTLGYLETGRLAPSPRDIDRLRQVFGNQAERMFETVSHGVEDAG